jgi:hypothetical protein
LAALLLSRGDCSVGSSSLRHPPLKHTHTHTHRIKKHQKYDNTKQATPNGLTSADAEARLQEYGPNALPERRVNPVVRFLGARCLVLLLFGLVVVVRGRCEVCVFVCSIVIRGRREGNGVRSVSPSPSTKPNQHPPPSTNQPTTRQRPNRLPQQPAVVGHGGGRDPGHRAARLCRLCAGARALVGARAGGFWRRG